MSRPQLWNIYKNLKPKNQIQWSTATKDVLKAEIQKINKISKSQLIKQLNIRSFNKFENKRNQVKAQLFEQRQQRKIQKKEIKISKNKTYQFLQNPQSEKQITLTAKNFLQNINHLQLHNGWLLEMHYQSDTQDHYKIITNYREIKDLLNNIKRGYSETITQDYGSDVVDIYNFVLHGGKITLRWFNANNYHRTHNGAYFKNFHNLWENKLKQLIDLSRYQVYSKYQKIDYEVCLYYSLEKAGLSEADLNSLKFMICEKDILLRDINNISKSFGFKIIVTYNDNRNFASKRIYNKEGAFEVNLGLVDEHYFINEETQYTSEIFTGKRDSRNRKLSSYDIIRRLYVESNKYLTPITIENINNQEHFLKFDSNYKLRDLKKVCKCDQEECVGLSDKCKYNEYRHYNNSSSKTIFQGKFKPENNPNLNYQLCFVDLETYNEDGHKPYCLGYSFENQDSIKFTYGLDCVTQFLDLLTTNTVIITHNLAFDFRGFIHHLTKFKDPIETGTKLKHIQCRYKYNYLVFKDNCAFLPFKLSDLPKMFNLKSGDKGIYPYDLITKDNNEDKMLFKDILKSKHIKECDYKEFEENCLNSRSIFTKDKHRYVDIKKYTIHYCNQDVNILKKSYMTFRSQIKEITKLDIITLISLPQLADEYFKSQGVYDGCYKISGVAQDFIRKAAHGGRVMTRKNKKYHITNKILSDFDAVSLYPSAMFRLLGYLKGIPKLITNSYLDKDYYFIEIEITNVKTHRAFPLASIKDNNGIKNYTNDIIGETIVVDKITLEDLIEFQGVEYKFIRGYYFDDGFNPKIKEVIDFMFNERIKLKQQENSLQNAYKLILNASYGKLIQKPIKTKKKFYEGPEYYRYVIKNAKNIESYCKINDNLIVINQKKSIINHFTGVHMACQVLSMSKRIMNEVMCLAEDNDLKIFYQDTDSMHIEQQHIKILSKKFKEKYNKELIGEKMGQFNSDFEVKGADKDYEINAVESIFLGKKAYIDKLEYKKNGQLQYDYHIRMKGMPSQIIKDYNENYLQTYLDLYNRKKIKLDMVSCCPLELTKNYKAINRVSFIRKLYFN
jgi:hypothetical protein